MDMMDKVIGIVGALALFGFAMALFQQRHEPRSTRTRITLAMTIVVLAFTLYWF
jgi:predicted membrane channel-forming protein YqfA (hemolysin III family)